MKDATTLLSARRDELTDRLSRLDRDARRTTEPLVADFAEQAVQRANDDVVDRLRESTSADLRAVSEALARLRTGTYGLCSVCGKQIEPARMEAMPATSHCLACESASTAG